MSSPAANRAGRGELARVRAHTTLPARNRMFLGVSLYLMVMPWASCCSVMLADRSRAATDAEA